MRFDESTCMSGKSLRAMLPAKEMRVIKRFLNTFNVRVWNKSYTEVDRSDPEGAWTIYIPQTGASDPTKHYFLVEKKGADGVTVRAGATQQIGSDPDPRAGSGGDEFVVENLTESSVLYAHYKRDTGDWDTAAPGFIKIAAIASLPTSDGENDYRPIAYITVEGTGTEGDPYTVTEIEQAHVGVLREPQLPAAPIEKSVLMYDPAAAVGSKLYWENLETFECPEEEV